MMTFDEWLNTYREEDKEELTLRDAWNAAIEEMMHVLRNAY